MTSIYAASSIHSKSTLSRKYEVNTSAMWNEGEKFRVKTDDSGERLSLTQFMQQFSLDVGRFNEVKPWINMVRSFTFPFFYVLGCSGILMTKQFESSIFSTFITILRHLIIILPDDSSFNISITFNVSLLLIYITLVLLMLRNMLVYKRGSKPDRSDIYFWIVSSRSFTQFFSCYISYYLSINIVNIVAKYDITALVNLIIAGPLFAIHSAYIFFSCSVYNATPIIRTNDVTQLWFSQSIIDSQVNIVLFTPIFIQCVLNNFESPIKEWVFMVSVICTSGYFALTVWLYVPCVWMKMNAFVMSTAFSSSMVSFFPIVTYYANFLTPFYFIAAIILNLVNYFLCKKIVAFRCRRILQKFADIHNNSETEGDDEMKLDPLSAAILHLNKTTNVDFLKMGISGDRNLSLYLRIGFLFNVPEVEDQTFIKWCTDQCVKADLLLSACQISYALQNDNRMLNSLTVQVSKLSSGPFNTKSFAMLFDHLRQELITQLNQPLLDAITQCKRASYSLQNFCSEFWGVAIKQRLQSMVDVLPQISHEIIRTDILFQNLLRNYPKSSTVYRETVIIYHKVLGDHVKTIDFQGRLNRLKKVGDLDSDTSSDLDDIDHNFQEQMDPWISVQQIIGNIKSVAKFLIITTSLLMVVLMILLPIIMLIISLARVNSFLRITEPIKIIGDMQYQISRIPQLIRRISLFQNGEIKDVWVGPVRGSLLEFINESQSRKFLKMYINDLESNLTSFLEACTNDKLTDNVCTGRSYEMRSGDSVTSTSLYDLVSAYLLAANNLKNIQDLRNVNNNSNMQFIFDNFDTAEMGISNTLSVLNDHVKTFHEKFDTLCNIFYICTFAVPIVVIIPMIMISLIYTSKQIKFDLRLFFGISKLEISNLRVSMKPSKGKEIKHVETINEDASMDEMNLRKEELIENLATVPRYRQGIFMGYIEVCLIFLFCTCVLSCIGIFVFNESMTEIIQVTNAYTYSITVFSNAACFYVWAQELFSKDPINTNATQIGQSALTYVYRFQDRFNTLLYGATNNSISPGLTLGEEIGNKYTKSSFIDTKIIVQNPIFGIIHDVYYSLSCEAQVSLMISISQWLLTNRTMTYDDNFTYHYEHMVFAHIIPFLERGMDAFAARVNKLNEQKTHELLIVYILLVVLQLLYSLVIVRRATIGLLHHVATPRKLLCLVPPEALMKSPTIVKWFSGAFSVSTNLLLENRSAMNTEAVEFACDHSKCGVALCDEFLQVQSANITFLRMMKMQELKVNEQIRPILMRALVDKDKLASIQRLERVAKKMTAGVSKTSSFSIESVIASENGQMQNVLVTLHGCSDIDDGVTHSLQTAQSFALVIQDNTTAHMQEELLRVEREKLQSLMNLVMPHWIRTKHEEGLDPSMQVDAGSVIVVTVKSELQGEELVKQIALIFSALDGAMDGETTRIRTCGANYIAATGLLTRIKSPGQTGSDVALKMLTLATKAVENQELTSIGIGVHTGNIKCGMVGVLQPVFDVVGDTAQGAMKLAEVCPPWLVHISQRTYNEIKYLKYNIKEVGGDDRGHTYLLSNNMFPI